MTLRVSTSPDGFKRLLVYQKADELQAACTEVTASFIERVKGEKWEGKGWKTISALQDQMDRSARSVKQNIVEGWKRNSTKEYYDFLGFSMGANAELEEDCDDIIKGRYEMGGKGLTGLKGEEGAEREKGGEKGERGQSPWTLDEVERLPFYPLNSRLPLLIQLKLRCKEMNFLLTKLQHSLRGKMSEGTRAMGAAWGTGERGKQGEEWLQKAVSEQGLVRAADGRLIKREEGEKSERG